MSRPSRMKRRLLRELVDENVAIVRGQLPRRSRRRSTLFRRTALVVFGLGSAALAAAVALAAAGRLPWWPSLTASPGMAIASPTHAGEPARGPVGLRAMEADSFGPEARFAAPEPLDPAGLPLAVRTIILDPGHGGDEEGTTGPHGLVEKELTLDVASRLHVLLEERSFKVLMTRSDDTAVSLEERARFANSARADIMLSIHVNWIPDRRTRGVETYYLGPTDDPFLTRLAAAENANSGYSFADFRMLLDRIYADVRRDESRKLAGAVQTAMFGSLRRDNPSLADWGVKTAPFIVLVATEMPAILAEVSCLSNQDEARLLQTAIYRQRIAEALCSGVESYVQQKSSATKGRDLS